MVTEATKKFRDVFAYGLLAVAALYLLSGLSLLFKSAEDSGPFSERAALFGHVFTHPLLVLSVLGAVLLAGGFGSASRNAKTIVTAALAIAGAALLLALMCWFSGFGVDSDGGLESFGGVLGAGKIVSILLGLAQLLLLALTTFFAFTGFRSLSQSAPQAGPTSPGWGQDTGRQGTGPRYGQSPGYVQGATEAGAGQWPSQSAYGDSQAGHGYPPPPNTPSTWTHNPQQQQQQQSFPSGVQQQGGWDAQPQAYPQPGAYGPPWVGGGQSQEWGGLAEAAPEQHPPEAAQPPVGYPSPPQQPPTAAPAAGATAVTPVEQRDGAGGDGHPNGAPQ